jgi:GNAT superfamily N-acetyltransferase
MVGIAELMRLCFGTTFDAQDRHTMREMEWLAQSGPLLWLLGSVPNVWQMGFVWLVDGKIVGNVSTQPSEGEAATWLIANVAVHPNYRSRGIARALTQAAIALATERGATQIILQVHHHNTAARHIYETMGFKEITTRTLWERTSGLVPPQLEVPGIELRLAPPDKWELSYEFVRRFRPAGFSWVRPLRAEDWQSDLFKNISHFLSAQRVETYWAIDTATNTLVGLFKISAGFHAFDEVQVVLYPHWSTRIERLLITAAVRRLHDRAWTIRLDHPLDESEEALTELNFRRVQTLVWMKLEL